MDPDTEALLHRIEELKVEHRDLDEAIAALVASGHADEIRLKRLKKRKLQLKDMISKLEQQLVPDIPA